MHNIFDIVLPLPSLSAVSKIFVWGFSCSIHKPRTHFWFFTITWQCLSIAEDAVSAHCLISWDTSTGLSTQKEFFFYHFRGFQPVNPSKNGLMWITLPSFKLSLLSSFPSLLWPLSVRLLSHAGVGGDVLTAMVQKYAFSSRHWFVIGIPFHILLAQHTHKAV